VNLAKHQNLNQVIVKKQLENEHKTGEWDQSSRYDSGTLDPLLMHKSKILIFKQ
jgi:hypothetical protein